MTFQLLRLSGDSIAFTPDSASLSITNNLDLRIRCIMDDWSPTGTDEASGTQTWIDKRQGGDEWQFRTDWVTGRPQLLWWDGAGVNYFPTATADLPFEPGQTGWVRVRKSGANCNFWYSTTDTNDHTAVTWTALGGTVTTNSGAIRASVATFVVIGGQGTGRSVGLRGFVYTAAILDDTTVRADPRFYDSTEWTVGEDHGDTASDGVNTWTLGGGAEIIGDNVEGAHVSVDCAFSTGPFDHALFWSDITEDVRAISTNRGRNAELARFDAGTATFEIDNTSGWYHSHNTASPYYPNVRPMVPIRVRALAGGTIYPIWSGFVERWPVNFPGNIESIATVDAVDLFKPLALADASQPDRAALVDALTPVAWWRFADDTDSSAAGTHDLTITGASTGDSGVWTGDFAGAFDGTSDFATVANETDVELRADMSLEMWFRPERSAVPTIETFNSDDTWTCPANVTAVQVEVWGGGGGGQGGDGGGYSGDGGGAGGYVRQTISVTPGVNYDIEVGAGGAGTADGGTGPAFSGGASWFGDDLLKATGGGGGQGLGNGGTAGQGTIGQLKRAGGRGGDGLRYNALGGINAAGGGGGGGAGGAPGGGQAGRSMDQNLTGGLGGKGPGDGGDGGDGGTPSLGAGQAGTAPGGGGGGGGATASSQSAGAAGAAGRVVLSYAVTEVMQPISVRGTTTLYTLYWDGFILSFGPSTFGSGLYALGEALSDTWHHVVVTIDWTGSGRSIVGYLNGQQVLTTFSSFEPAIEARVVNIGRRATDNDRYFQGDISEIAIYDSILTPQDVSNLYAAQLEGFATQPTGERIQYVLETAEVGVGLELTDFNLDTGQTIISGPNSPTDVTALEAIQLAADTEFGSFFIAGDGTPTFQDRHHRSIDMVTPLATLDETDYETIHLLGRDDLKVANDVRVAPSDTAEPFIVTDADSKDTYGRRTLEVTVYPDDQNEAYDAAVWLLGLFKEPKDDIASIPFRLYEEVSDFATLLAAELGDRYNIEVPLAGDDLDVDVYLERISHNIDQVSWSMDWGVTPASDATTFWLLGVAGNSELGETTVLGF